MQFLFYTHSLVSDWNHGNAHFLRGIMRELIARGHEALALEPADGWSRTNLAAQHGELALQRFKFDFPELISQSYGDDFEHDAQLSTADVVVVHEWTDPRLVARIGKARRNGGTFTLLFHDTHHRTVSEAGAISALPLAEFDGVLAFGETLRQRYLHAGWGRNVHTWHEAADVRLFKPDPSARKVGDLVWTGNWGDDERTAEIHEYLIEPVRELKIRTAVHGVRYPEPALAALADAGIDYRGWCPNSAVPRIFAGHLATVHIPRRPYSTSLPGIPTIRIFEALACGIPLVSAPWHDVEGLFRGGIDFLYARNTIEMSNRLRDILHQPALARSLVSHGLETIAARHTCGHRVDQLFDVLMQCGSARVVDALKPREAAQ
jgi:spore maturation protein CgeB